MSKLRGLWRLIRLVLHLLHGLWTMRRYFPDWPQARRDLAVQQWSQALLRIAGLQLQVKGLPVQRAPIFPGWTSPFCTLLPIAALFPKTMSAIGH